MYTRSNLASIRVKKDIAELSSQQFVCGQASTSIEFPEGHRNILKMTVMIKMLDGLYQGGQFIFALDVPTTYPFHPPKVKCTTKVWHPNIEPQTGEVQLAILERDWRPVLSINTVIFGLQLLFLEPSVENSINQAAAYQITNNTEIFHHQVREYIQQYALGVSSQTRNNFKRKRSVMEGCFKMAEGELKTDLEAMHIQDVMHQGMAPTAPQKNVKTKRFCCVERPTPRVQHHQAHFGAMVAHDQFG
mmetsp:Transcript_20122/g.26072  ORF Transcript_20122/g.26072 Transcript_20122/m.26072 type:complete len:246 (-) Transcript_20122:565-1302(-)